MAIQAFATATEKSIHPPVDIPGTVNPRYDTGLLWLRLHFFVVSNSLAPPRRWQPSFEKAQRRGVCIAERKVYRSTHEDMETHMTPCVSKLEVEPPLPSRHISPKLFSRSHQPNHGLRMQLDPRRVREEHGRASFPMLRTTKHACCCVPRMATIR